MGKGVCCLIGPRTPREDEAGACAELAYRVFFSSRFPDFLSGASTWPMVLRDGALKDTFAMFDGDKPVSLIHRFERDVLIHGCKLRIGFVGFVCTHPDYRGRGLASTILAATMNKFREDDVDFVCISGDRTMYRRAGARPIGGRREFVVNRENSEKLREHACKVSIRKASLEDAELLASIYDRESIRFIRPLSDYEIVLKYRHCVGRPCEFVIAGDETKARAYLLLTEPQTQEGRSSRTVFEYAGERNFVLSAIHHLAKETELRVKVEGNDPLGEMLTEVGIEGTPVQKPGTVAVLDFAKTMRKLIPFFASRLPANLVQTLDFAFGNERFVAWCDDGILEIDGITNMVWTLLGTPPGENLTGVRVVGKMEELHKRCLPIPLPSLEMNMV
ncbi:MAG: GNAT family N-acetyltransferase [Armatimonadetes bacterium]|nr:GNAT family N-acetyltransferase [Armatimonadota bacterium]MCX7967544.1 GNAT family N-acetyltransferase [Armatimonadota bacterium]MDW8144405.1 GNAT family N-acetyltransferase [Armatimonadota bacterium]